MLFYTVLIALPVMAFCQFDILANAEFHRFDLNGDGSIEYNEIENYYRRFDTNGDNRISRAEYQREVTTQHLNNPYVHQVLSDLFDELDFDNDEVLEHSDFNHFLTNADTSGDNIISHQEFIRYFHQITGTPFVG